MARFRPRQNQVCRVRNRGWAGSAPTAFTALAVSTKVLAASFTLSVPDLSETILRTVGSLFIKSDQAAALEEQLGAFGGVVVTDRALTTGITAIPDPVTEVADDSWMVYQPIVQMSNIAVTGIGGVRYDFDSKGKRVIEDGHGLAFVIANASTINVLQFVLYIRVLSILRGT